MRTNQNQKNSEGCGGLGGENPAAFPQARPIFQQPFSLPESTQTLAGIASRAAGKSENHFPAASKFAGKPFQQGIFRTATAFSSFLTKVKTRESRLSLLLQNPRTPEGFQKGSEGVSEGLRRGQLRTLQNPIQNAFISGLQKGPAERGHVKKHQKSSKSVKKFFDTFRQFSRRAKNVKNRQKVSKSFSTLFDNFRAAPFFRPLLQSADLKNPSKTLQEGVEIDDVLGFPGL